MAFMKQVKASVGKNDLAALFSFKLKSLTQSFGGFYFFKERAWLTQSESRDFNRLQIYNNVMPATPARIKQRP